VIHKEKILVLRLVKYGESDLIVHGLNTLGARMNFFVRGGAKSRKRFPGGILEPTHYLEVGYRQGSANEGDPLHSLLEAQLIREFPKLRTDYKRLDVALNLLKLVGKLSQQGVIDSPDLFNLLGNTLAAAETSNDLDKLKVHFELKLLANQGILPGETLFKNWLSAGIAQHEQIPAEGADRRWVEEQVHAHLRQYLGTL
jgi:DNA repair protein RecO (recombination protein O)